MKKQLLALVLLAPALSFGQAQLVEKVDPQPGKFVIPYEKYKLPNGLTLVIHEDHSDPIAHVNVTYHVGSARELPGKSGFAHFFEHMLFQGSEHVADEEHFKILQAAGGTVNGNTTRDRTVYIETVPSNYVETALWLEADRMGFLLDSVTTRKFEIQRSTVKNEKDQRYDVPYGFLQEVKDQNLYPQGHPYSWPVIGYVDDLDRVTVNDLKNFFLRWYSPNNATVIVSGDVDPKEVVAWTEKYYGSIPRGPEVKKQYVSPVNLPQNTLARYTDSRVFQPLLYVTYPAAPAYSKDEAALDILGQLLAGSKKTPFYKHFVDNELAVFAQANNNPMSSANHELAGEFTFIIVPYPMLDLNVIRDTFDQTLVDFEKTGFSDADLERIKREIMNGYYGIIESVESKASVLSSYSYLLDKPFNLQDDIDRYTKVTKEDIWRVFNRYIKGRYRSMVYIEPDMNALMGGGDNKENRYKSFNPNATATNPAAEKEYQNLVYNKAKDNFDRSVKPVPSAAKQATLPEYFEHSMSNGIKVIGTTTTESPMVTILMNIKGGHLFEGKEFKYGTAGLLADMLDESTEKYSSEQIEEEIGKLGSSISFSSTGTGITASISSLRENLPATLALFQEKLMHPAFNAKDFKRVKKQSFQNLENMKRNRTAAAGKAYSRLLYGEDNPLGMSASGEPKTLDKITLEDVKKFYSTYLSPNVTKIVAVGNFDAEQLKKDLSFLENWQNKNVTLPSFSSFPEWQTTQIFLVNMPNSDQTEIRAGYRALPYDATGEFFKSTVMNFPLGGNFNSRLNLNIREKNAWTYGIRGGFGGSYENVPGTYTVSCGVKRDATDSAIREIIAEMARYRDNGITDEELDYTRKSIVLSEALNYESQFQKAGFLYSLIDRNLPKDYPTQQMNVANTIGKDEINALAKKHIQPEKLIIVVAGDAYYIKPKLEKMGFGKVQELDENGAGKKAIYPKK